MSEQTGTSDKKIADKSKSRRLAAALFLVALSFYVAFIVVTALSR